METESRNLKGEIIHDDNQRWYDLSSSTWLLIGGLLLFNVGCFVNPGIIDTLFRSLDVRLWPWWYFLVLGIIVTFSIKWYFIYRNGEDYDELDREKATRFNRMSIVISVVLSLLVILNAMNLLYGLYFSLKQWLGMGVFTWIALVAFVFFMTAICLVFYFIKEWIVSICYRP